MVVDPTRHCDGVAGVRDLVRALSVRLRDPEAAHVVVLVPVRRVGAHVPVRVRRRVVEHVRVVRTVGRPRRVRRLSIRRHRRAAAVECAPQHRTRVRHHAPGALDHQERRVVG